MSGHPLSKEELALLNVIGWRVGNDDHACWDYYHSNEENGVGTWLKARALVKAAREVEIGVTTEIGDFAMIINCPRDAFERAEKTLKQRMAQGGQQWTVVWLANQDAVFANCSPAMPPAARSKSDFQRPLVMPPALPQKASEWLVKDHAYQSAAALFYAGRYNEARERFLSIAKDAKSPWQSLGKYLAARCLLRQASTMPVAIPDKGKGKTANELLKLARGEIVAIGSEYPPAQRLVNWIDFRLRPEERCRELSAILSSARITNETPQMLTDYLFLLDQMKSEDMIGAADAMTAWIGAMQVLTEDTYSRRASKEAESRRKSAIDLARARWNKKHEMVWLLPLLNNAHPGELKPNEIQAATDVKEESAAYASLQYHLARLEIAAGKSENADAIISAMLKKPLPAYVRNRWLRMKMVTARSAEGFFSAAPRKVADDEHGVPVPNKAVLKEMLSPCSTMTCVRSWSGTFR